MPSHAAVALGADVSDLPYKPTVTDFPTLCSPLATPVNVGLGAT
jgi:hypothetical protein